MSRRGRLLAAAGLVALLALAGGVDRVGGQGGPPSADALPAIARTLAAAVLLFSLSGYALARTILPTRLRADMWLFVLPLGAVSSALALTLLGFLAVPFPAGLAAVLAAGAGSAVHVRRRLGPEPATGTPEARRTLRWAALLAALIVAVAVTPLLRADSFATVTGNNGDAHLATGAAVLLQHTYPSGTDIALPVDRMPGAWRSKYPIYYSLAAASTLSGLDPPEAFVAFGALLLVLTGAGFFLLARHMLGAAPEAAIVSMAMVGLAQHTLHLALEPFYNQLWGTLALPFTLLGAWLYLTEPGRGMLALSLPFLVVGSLAYPLLAPFTLAFIAVAALLVWRDREPGDRPGWLSALRLPRGRRWMALGVVLAAVTVPVLVVLSLSAAEKVVDGVAAALPGGDLGPWSGEALGFLSLARAVGVSVVPVLAPVLLGAAIFGLWRRPRHVAVPLALTTGGLLLAAAYLRLRTGGELFVFKALGFGGVMVLGLAGVGLAEAARAVGPRGRVPGVAAAALVLAVVVLGAREEVADTAPHLTRELVELRDWSDELPGGASVRVDIAAVGKQQWAWYMLADRPVTAAAPLLGFFPYAPKGRKADYLIVDRHTGRPPDAAGRALRVNDAYVLFRMRPGVPGPDVASRRMIDPFVYSDRYRPGSGL